MKKEFVLVLLFLAMFATCAFAQKDSLRNNAPSFLGDYFSPRYFPLLDTNGRSEEEKLLDVRLIKLLLEEMLRDNRFQNRSRHAFNDDLWSSESRRFSMTTREKEELAYGKMRALRTGSKVQMHLVHRNGERVVVEKTYHLTVRDVAHEDGRTVVLFTELVEGRHMSFAILSEMNGIVHFSKEPLLKANADTFYDDAKKMTHAGSVMLSPNGVPLALPYEETKSTFAPIGFNERKEGPLNGKVGNNFVCFRMVF